MHQFHLSFCNSSGKITWIQHKHSFYAQFQSLGWMWQKEFFLSQIFFLIKMHKFIFQYENRINKTFSSRNFDIVCSIINNKSLEYVNCFFHTKDHMAKSFNIKNQKLTKYWKKLSFQLGISKPLLMLEELVYVVQKKENGLTSSFYAID